MSNRKKIASYAYFIQGGVNPKTILIKALGIVISQEQHKGNDILNKYDKLRNAYQREYKTVLPCKTIESAIEESFDIVDGKYEFKKSIGMTIDSVVDEIRNEKNRFDEKINILKKEFSDFFIKRDNKVTKQIINGYFQNYILENIEEKSEYDIDDENSEYANLRIDFFKYLLDSKPELYDVVESITIAEAMADVPADVYDFSYKDCIFYLDTPVLMKYLGYDGPEYRNVYCAVVESLQGFGVSFYVFEHTIDEIWGILYAWKLAWDKNNYLAKGLDTYLKARKYYKKDADTIIPLSKDGLLAAIENAGVKKKAKPPLSTENVIYDEKKIISLFEEKYKTTYESFPDRINKDVDSIFGIQSLRLADDIRTPDCHEAAKYFILSDNKPYYSIANINYRKEHNILQAEDSLCEVQYADYVILSIWQKNGKQVLPKELFKARVLSSDVISKEFRQEFLIILNRLSYLGEADINRLISEKPEVLQKAASLYREKHSIEDLMSFLTGELKTETEKSHEQRTNDSSMKETSAIPSEDDNSNVAHYKVSDSIDLNELQKREMAVRKREEKLEQDRMELDRLKEELDAKVKKLSEKSEKPESLWHFIKRKLFFFK